MNLKLKQLDYLLVLSNILTFAILLFLVLFVVNDCYHVYLTENKIFNDAKISTNSTAHLDKFVINVLMSCAWGLGKISLGFFVVLMTKFLLFAIPVPSKYLISLDKDNQISSILGRILSDHFRLNTSISFKKLILLSRVAEYEEYMLSHHQNKKKYIYFLEKYDSFYSTDTQRTK